MNTFLRVIEGKTPSFHVTSTSPIVTTSIADVHGLRNCFPHRKLLELRDFFFIFCVVVVITFPMKPLCSLNSFSCTIYRIAFRCLHCNSNGIAIEFEENKRLVEWLTQTSLCVYLVTFHYIIPSILYFILRIICII